MIKHIHGNSKAAHVSSPAEAIKAVRPLTTAGWAIGPFPGGFEATSPNGRVIVVFPFGRGVSGKRQVGILGRAGDLRRFFNAPLP